MMVITVGAFVWGILYFLQHVPGPIIYVIAIRRMLREFANFGLVFGLFFFSFTCGIGMLAGDTSLTHNFYNSFQLMLT